MGVRHSLFPAPTLGARLAAAAGFPTPFSTASGVFGLVAGPSSALPRLDCRVRLLSSLRLVVAPPACEPGQDTFVTLLPRLDHSARGRPPVVSGALAPCDGSRLFTLRLPFAHKPAVPFVASPAFRKVFTGLAVASCPSRDTRSVCPAFRRLSLGESRFWNRQSRAPRAGTQ